jgi:uncharacterized protein YbjT (DUF2867 family)
MQDLVTVFGGSGFIGSQVVRQLARKGLRIRVAVRQPHLAIAQRLHGEVGQIEIVQANIRNEASVRRAVEGASAVVNLVAVMHEKGRQKFQAVHVMGARVAARAAKAAGATRFVQVSAIGADPASDSKYARTKGEAELAVREEFPGAVVIRPSIVFGPEDKFFNRFGAMATRSPALPLLGAETKFQPVFVGDVAKAVAQATVSPAAEGKTYELGGPTVHTMRQLMELLLAQIERRRFLIPVPAPIAGLLGQVGDLIALSPFTPPITSDQAKLLSVDNVVSPGALGLADLGVEPTGLEPVLGTYLYRFRKGGQYADLTEMPAVG